MHPVLLSLLLGSTAAAANVFGGTIIVKRNWDRSYLKYFVALGAGFMLATAILEIVPASFDLREKDAPILILAGYLITHFFEHTVTQHFHFGEETHAAASDLVPEVNREPGGKRALVVLLVVAVCFLLDHLVH